jgi:hypothetical protein
MSYVEPTPYMVAKSFLEAMSDETFLSSLDYVDFTNKYVSVKPGYWKYFIVTMKDHYHLNSVNLFLRAVKSLFLNRLHLVSANKLKRFFLNQIYNSFFNFKNLLPWVLNNFDSLDRNTLKKLRESRYFEKKAKKAYLDTLTDVVEQDQQAHHQTLFERLDNINDHEATFSGFIEETKLTSNFQSEDEEEYSPLEDSLPVDSFSVYTDQLLMTPQEFISSVRNRISDMEAFSNYYSALPFDEKVLIINQYFHEPEKTDFITKQIWPENSQPVTERLDSISVADRQSSALVELNSRLRESYEIYGPPLDQITVDDDHNRPYQNIETTVSDIIYESGD